MKFIKLILMLTLILNAKNIELNFQNLKLDSFIKLVAKITHKNILLTNNMVGKVNFVSVKPVNEKDIYAILLSVLRSKGYTLIEDHGYLKVVRSSEAYRDAPPLSENTNLQEIQTDIISLKNIPVRDAYTQIAYLLSRYGKIVLNKEKNLIIITDYPANLAIIKQILEKIDTKNKNEVKFVDLKFTDVNKIYSKVLEIATNLYNINALKYKIIKNDNANSLILVGPKEIVNKLTEIIKKLDVKPNMKNQVTKIIALKNSDVKYMQTILKNIINMKYARVQNKPSVTADKETNSIIVIATPEQFEIIKTIIQALDVPKMQVYVKARILEISNSKASQLGSKLGLIGGSATNSGLYTMSANLGGPALAFNPAELGISMPVLKSGLALGATLDLLETFGAAKKLSEPSILCINNTPSTIYVGKTVSVLTGKTTSTSTSESYTRQDIGLSLKVTPRIDSDNKVSLNVAVNVEDILPGSTAGLPTTSKRKIQTTTIVNNGQSIIIGGLVKNNNDVTIKKVPFFGDIPLLGALFRHKEVSKDRTTLAVVLTPYIVKRSSNLDILREKLVKLNELEKGFVAKIIKEKKLKKSDKK